MNRIALHIWVTGRVQGVWYRQSTKEQAERNGVSGWVKNLSDGRVEALLQGEANAVRDVEAWMNQGPPLATVAETIVEQAEVDETLKGFEVH
ncbi:acylphosphatase [Motiliproteus sp. MSK22-1]|uniref:acylphosphatase n=1 Tax=Motiliproteus sp. MSK22-1 TaxID=1897630 RepID=UPI000977001E|nr:acylphosphatase [Motiliproteus sp. MSK22-1]OMH25890.1 acylphosphatase [Motiliproteus sp. MSK22-1]